MAIRQKAMLTRAHNQVDLGIKSSSTLCASLSCCIVENEML